VQPGGTVTVIYTGWLYSNTAAENKGNIFNGPNQRYQTALNPGVIAGWQQGIPGMRVGGVRRLVIPTGTGLRLGNARPRDHSSKRDAALRSAARLDSLGRNDRQIAQMAQIE
jgi:hypothetical protein